MHDDDIAVLFCIAGILACLFTAAWLVYMGAR